jgi:hypothetical protein
VIDSGQEQGKAVRDAMREWLRATGGTELGDLGKTIQNGLGTAHASELPDALAGVMLGFPPTVQGNFIRTMEEWIDSEKLWSLQQSLYAHGAKMGTNPDTSLDEQYQVARAALRGPMIETMREKPVPEMLWRCPVDHAGKADTRPGNRVVLGIKSALTDPQAPSELLFGRDRDDAAATVHGCPGYYMATGVLLAMYAGLLSAGTLRPTGSPVLLILTPVGSDASAPH